MRVQSGLDSDRSGTLEAAEITSTAYICIGATIATVKSWRTAQLIETDETSNALEPQIAVDNNGNAMAVWNQSDGTRTSIYANRFSSATGAWAAPVLIENDDIGDANSQRIAIDINGNALAVWAQATGGAPRIYANRYTAATNSWGTAQLIGTGAADGSNPQIAMDGGGNAQVVWYQRNRPQPGIWNSRFIAATNSWTAAQLIEAASGADISDLQIAVNANGDALAMWLDADAFANPPRYFLIGKWFVAATISWDSSPPVVSANVRISNPQITLDVKGNAVAVWEQRDGTVASIFGSRYLAASNNWSLPVRIEAGSGNALEPQIATDANGNVLAVWSQSDGVRNNLWANRFIAATGSWGVATQIESSPTGIARRPQIAIDGSGNGIAVWDRFDGTQNSVYAIRFTASTNSWGSAELIETDNAGSATSAQISVNASGNAVAVWEQVGNSRRSIAANTFR